MRTSLTVLVLIVLLPQLGLGGLIAYKYANDARVSVEDSSRRLAATFSDTLDRFLEGSVASIQTLAATGDPDDLRRLDAYARQLLPLRGTAISMRDRAGQQLLNTVVPFGTTLPITSSEVVIAADKHAFDSGAPVFSNLYRGTVSNKYFFLIDVPVERAGERKYALNLAVSSDDLRQIMFKGLPIGWSASVVDGNGRIMARAVDQDRFVGQPATGILLRSLEVQKSGSIQSTTLDGTRSYSSFVRSPLSNYAVVVSAPRALLDKPVQELWLWLSGLAFVAVASSSLAAWWWSRNIVSSLTQLERSALTDASGGAFDYQSPIREFNSVAKAIIKAAADIREKTVWQDRLIAELNHRVKNTLAILQAITIGTVQTKSKRELADSLRFRIHGLAAAHDLLNANDWEGVDIRKVLQAASSATAHVFDALEGPRIDLTPKAVVALSQAFTELCEGAIFCHVPSSRVQWAVDGGEIGLRWEGVCAPDSLQAADPFSTRILHLCVERQLAGKFEFSPVRDDWEWVCSIPLESHLGVIGKVVEPHSEMA